MVTFPRSIYNSTQQTEFAKDWFWYIEHSWFPNRLLNPPALSDSVEYINELLEDAWDQGDADRALFEIERIQKNLIDMSPFEKSITSKLCAHILLSMSDREQSEEMMRQALIWMPSSYRHYVAVLTWLLGITHWLRSSKHADAINEWKAAIGIFYDISMSSGLTITSKTWYDNELVFMRKALRKAIEIDQLPPLDNFKLLLTGQEIPARRKFGTTVPRYAKDEQIEVEEEDFDFAQDVTPILLPENFFQLFVVYDEIRAGLPGPIAYSPSPRYPAGHSDLDPSDYIEVSRVMIGHREYAVKILQKGSQRLSLISNAQFYILRVQGDSMNMAGIDDGDYVVMRSQMIADNGDIIAAEIVGVDVSRATLKRYTKKGKTVTLKAESDSKEFAGKKGVWDFTAAEQNKDDKFFIRGVAVAVLKPV